MELERHIEILLLDNDCVIVPGLGGFIAYHTDARYDAESASFLPPTRVAGFNPKLSMNDNLLAQSYVETYDISYPEAVKRISAEADALRESLEHSGSYEIPGVGTLTVNDKGGYDFIPFEAGLLTPEYYGLGCFEVSNISEENNAEDIQDAAEDSDDDSGKFIRIRVSTLRYAAAAAVAIFAFFLISTPLGNSSQNMASVAGLQNSVFYKMMPMELTSGSKSMKTEKASPEKPVQAATANPAAKADSIKDAAIKAPGTITGEMKTEAKKAEAEDYYSIVLASALSRHNAENFVKKLTSEGRSNINAIKCSNGMKVICGKFASEQEARMSLDSLRTDKNFKDAWIYKVRVK